VTPFSAGAVFSPCRTFRYRLGRVWGDGPTLTVIGLNPSTADETSNDPTVRRCIAFAMREGCGSLRMLNIFAFRATDPAVMKRAVDPIGPENDMWIMQAIDGPVVAAWGVHGAFLGRGASVARAIPGLLCFGQTKDGHPKHPLYLRADSPLVNLR